MKIKVVALVMFALISSMVCFARTDKDVGIHKTTVNGKEKNAIALALPVSCDNAAFLPDGCILNYPQVAATHDVAYLTKAPTVEVKAIAIVGGGRSVRRLCNHGQINKFTKSAFVRPVLHIDPGLRGC